MRDTTRWMQKLKKIAGELDDIRYQVRKRADEQNGTVGDEAKQISTAHAADKLNEAANATMTAWRAIERGQ